MKLKEQFRDEYHYLGNLNPLYLENLLTKADVSKRRKKNLSPKQNDFRKSHWANHAGTYKDPEFHRFPKFYKANKSVLNHQPIKSRSDLLNALELISNGQKNHDNYKNVSSLNRDRLRLATSLRDRGIKYDPKEISNMHYQEIERLSNKDVYNY